MDTTKIFNTIAANYNLYNHLFSFNFDKFWRRELIDLLKEDFSGAPSFSGVNILDIACGTGDLTLAEAKAGFRVTGVDISDGMLQIARKRLEKREFDITPKILKEDATSLSIESKSFEAVTIGYGIRNFNNREASLNEILRVLKPGGRLYILEFGEPTNKMMKFFYHIYFREFMPLSVRLLSRGKEWAAYRYFVQSVKNFPKFEEFCLQIEAAGFKNVSFKRQTGGISVLYIAEK